MIRPHRPHRQHTLPTRPAWPLLLAALAFGTRECLALWRSRGAERRAQARLQLTRR